MIHVYNIDPDNKLVFRELFANVLKIIYEPLTN